MQWSDVGRIVGKVAPVLGNVLVGNIPGAVATAGALIASELGTDNTPDAVGSALAANPELLVRVKEIEAKHDVDLRTLALQSQAAELGDIQGARQRDVDLAKAGQKTNTKTWMILGDVVVVLACIVFLVAVPTAGEAVRGLIGTIAAGAVLCLRDAHQFEFGSSRSSQNKDVLLADRKPA